MLEKGDKIYQINGRQIVLSNHRYRIMFGQMQLLRNLTAGNVIVEFAKINASAIVNNSNIRNDLDS